VFGFALLFPFSHDKLFKYYKTSTNEATKKLVESGKIDASWNEYNVTVAGIFGEFKLWLK
jgi:hypothetical protein